MTFRGGFFCYRICLLRMFLRDNCLCPGFIPDRLQNTLCNFRLGDQSIRGCAPTSKFTSDSIFSFLSGPRLHLNHLADI